MSTAGISVTFLIAVDSSRIPFFVTSWLTISPPTCSFSFSFSSVGEQVGESLTPVLLSLLPVQRLAIPLMIFLFPWASR